LPDADRCPRPNSARGPLQPAKQDDVVLPRGAAHRKAAVESKGGAPDLLAVRRETRELASRRRAAGSRCRRAWGGKQAPGCPPSGDTCHSLSADAIGRDIARVTAAVDRPECTLVFLPRHSLRHATLARRTPVRAARAATTSPRRVEDRSHERRLRPELLPGLSQKQGFRASCLLRRPVGHEIEFVTIILWESLDNVRALAGDDYEKALIPEDRLPLLSRYDARAAHYEIVSTNEPAPK